ncbi:hypothetical protein Q4E40_18255 [Pontibacter sp. BT731]|uniref:5-methylcytosine restriction system specificity protein McrC n=1 Tax=Pontibacter coccineus TaxID=3063328 RepID=UPI0026E3D482|nr:hypothetical protein [Pontibacter sp. BT731]MDO6392084.1 hypothetical protein [Pontibacter sp. BT731]
MSIPIQNIYYMLAYAWDKLEEAEVLNVGTDKFDDVFNLLTKVLVNGVNHLLKRGLDRDYLENEDLTNRLRGKILFQPSIKQNTFQQALAYCAYDDLSYNVLHNRLIRAMLEKIRNAADLDNELQHEVRQILARYPAVSTQGLGLASFKQVRLHRNNSNYKLLLSICKLIWEELLLIEEVGERPFKNFVQDKRKMAYLFESFLLNFYKKHLDRNEWEVKREGICWLLSSLNLDSDADFIPSMGTDISLISNKRHIILDAKFYPEALKSRYDKKKLISSNLYQIFSYVQNLRDNSKEIEGVLVYPEVQQSLSLAYKFQRWDKPLIRAVTVNLNQDWRLIENDLLDLVLKSPSVRLQKESSFVSVG